MYHVDVVKKCIFFFFSFLWLPDEDSGLEELFTMCMDGFCESESFSCTDRCGSSLPDSRSCQCDHECLSLGDCCLDYEHLCIPLAIRHHTRMVASSLPGPDTSLSSSVSQEDEGNRTASSEFIGDNFLIPPSVIVANYPDFDLSLRRSHMHLGDRDCVKVGNYKHFLFVKKCMDSAYSGSQLEQQCQMATSTLDFLASLPVAVTNGTHYRNIYCAFCSGIQYKDIYFWKIGFDCGSDRIQTHHYQGDVLDTVGIMMKLCDYDILPNLAPGTQIPRSCTQEQESEDRCRCSRGSAQNTCQQLRDTYSYPVIVHGNWYKNVHSAFCNEEFNGTGSTNITCSFDNWIRDKNSRPFSLPMLFTFSIKDGALLTTSTNEFVMSPNSSSCDINEWFDPFLKECRAIYCPSNTFVIDGVCVKNLKPSNLTFDQCSTNSSFWKQKYEEKLQETDKYRQRTSWLKIRAVSNHESALNLIMVTFRVTLKSEKLDVNIKNLKTVSSSTRNDTLHTQSIVFELHLTDNTSDFTNMPSAIRRAVRLLAYDSGITMSVRSVEWKTYESLSVHTDICTESQGDVFLRVLWAKDTTDYSDGEYDELLLNEDMFNEYQPKKLTIFTDNNKEWSRFNLHCCSSPLMCRQISFNSTEFDWDNVLNGTLLHKASGIVIPSDMFSLDGNGFVRVCEDMFDNQNITTKLKGHILNSQTYVTLVGNAISIISLLATLVTMCTFPVLQNLPGKIISCLSISLLLANIFMLISYPSSSEWLCLLFGVSLHYIWLSVFFWANALAIDMTRTFRVNSKRMVFRIKGNVQFIIYSLYAWCSPAIIVTIGVLIHFLSERRIYNTVGTCWLIAGQPIITLFLLPFTFFMVVNTALFIVVLVSISKTKDGMDNVTESSINIQSRAIAWLAIKVR